MVTAIETSAYDMACLGHVIASSETGPNKLVSIDVFMYVH